MVTAADKDSNDNSSFAHTLCCENVLTTRQQGSHDERIEEGEHMLKNPTDIYLSVCLFAMHSATVIAITMKLFGLTLTLLDTAAITDNTIDSRLDSEQNTKVKRLFAKNHVFHFIAKGCRNE